MQRGPKCPDIYSIHVTVPEYATHIDISFSNKAGESIGIFRAPIAPHEQHANRSQDYMNKKILAEMGDGSACEVAMFPDTFSATANCKMPVGQIATGVRAYSWSSRELARKACVLVPKQANFCELDTSTGCTNPDAMNYDPLATTDSGSCEIPQ